MGFSMAVVAIHGLLTMMLISLRLRYVGEHSFKNEAMIRSSGLRSESRFISSMFLNINKQYCIFSGKRR